MALETAMIGRRSRLRWTWSRRVSKRRLILVGMPRRIEMRTAQRMLVVCWPPHSSGLLMSAQRYG